MFTGFGVSGLGSKVKICGLRFGLGLGGFRVLGVLRV